MKNSNTFNLIKENVEISHVCIFFGKFKKDEIRHYFAIKLIEISIFKLFSKLFYQT